MADSLRPPGHLDVENGNISHNFIKLKRQMEIYLTACGNAEKDEKIHRDSIAVIGSYTSKYPITLCWT
jgi:hypothetical protein